MCDSDWYWQKSLVLAQDWSGVSFLFCKKKSQTGDKPVSTGWYSAFSRFLEEVAYICHRPFHWPLTDSYRELQKPLLTGVFSPPVPMSQPVLTLSPLGAQVAEGEVVTLHCKVHRGSSRILYKLYHEGVILGSSLAPSEGEGASFSFPLTTEHSGNYYCSADNGFGPRCSEAVSLSVIGESVLDSCRSLMPDPDPSHTNLLLQPSFQSA